MQYRELKPSLPLASVVKCFWSVEAEPDGPASPELVLPDGCPEIVFNLSDRFQKIDPSGSVETQAAAVVSGQLRSHISIRRTGKVDLFGIRFQPFGASAFLRVPLSELNDQVVSLDGVIGRRSCDLEEKIAATPDFNTRIAVAKKELGLAESQTNPPRFLIPMISEIYASPGRSKIDELRGEYGIGERQLQRVFARHVGVSPKMFSRIVRFQNLVRRIESAENENLLESALDLGYYDQSHMTREFKEFAGKSPLSYFRETHQLSELFTAV